METRRLQHIKGGSYILSLPKEWIEKRKLERGEEIAVFEEDDGSLMLLPIKMERKEPQEVLLTFEDFSNVRALEYCIGTYYIQGSNKINIKSKSMIPANVKRQLKLLRMDLPGVEVAEERADMISFQVIVDPAAFSLKSLVEKTSSFALHLQVDAIRSLLEGDFKLAKEVIERSREALRHYRMTIRQVALASSSKAIAKQVDVKDCRECVTFALTARDLNRLVYHSSSIAGHLLTFEGEPEMNHEILDLIKHISDIVREMQKDAVKAFLNEDVNLAIITMAKMNNIRRKEKELLTIILEKVEDTDQAVALSHIARDLRRIAGHSIAIADDAMNRTLAPRP
ncbi:MAG: PhoU domain-containing protein [Candidatus Bathyarchaeota archaeon]|jgi:phosphate uptake regulator